jgi:Uma2 family endonuclease
MSLSAAEPFPLSVEQYLAMARQGILGPEDRVELLEGVLVAKMSKGPPHLDAVYRLFQAFLVAVGPGWVVNKEDPIVAGDSMPEPDLAVLRGPRATYANRLPRAIDAALVVEVSDASLARDRIDKKRIDARAGIPIYWIANLAAGRFEVYSDPTGPVGPGDTPDYRTRLDYASGDQIALVLDGVAIADWPASELLPSPPTG